MAVKHGLGRGLGALLKDSPNRPPSEPDVPTQRILTIPVAHIRKSRWQTRQKFDDAPFSELVQSVRQHGIVQPLLVRKIDAETYELIAGERRLRAAKEAGLVEVPTVIMVAADREAAEIGLIENLQREDLNVLEEAEGYEVLVRKFGLTQEQIAERVGRSRAAVANTIRLLHLPAKVRELVLANQLSAGHAKLIAGIESPEEQIRIALQVVAEGLSVRNLEKMIQADTRAPRRKSRARKDDIPSTHLTHLQDRLLRHFGTNVRIASCRTSPDGKKTKGTLEIDFYSNDDLSRILELCGITDV